jgi:ATP-binding cassette subfamily C protein
MSGGRIIEDGGHRELIVAGGVYADLWAAWEAGQGLR